MAPSSSSSASAKLKERVAQRLQKLNELPNKKFGQNAYIKDRFGLFPGVENQTIAENRELTDYLLNSDEKNLSQVTTSFYNVFFNFIRDVDRNEAHPISPAEVQTYIVTPIETIVFAAISATSATSTDRTLWSELVPKFISIINCAWFFPSSSSSPHQVHPAVRRSVARASLLLNAMELFLNQSVTAENILEDSTCIEKLVNKSIDWEIICRDLPPPSTPPTTSTTATTTTATNSSEKPRTTRDPFGAQSRASVTPSQSLLHAQTALKEVLSPAVSSSTPGFFAPFVRAVQCCVFNTQVWTRLYSISSSSSPSSPSSSTTTTSPRSNSNIVLPPHQVHAVVLLYFLRPMLVQWSGDFSSSKTTAATFPLDVDRVARVLCTSALLVPVSDGGRLQTPGTSIAGLRTLSKNEKFAPLVLKNVLWMSNQLEKESPQCKSLALGIENFEIGTIPTSPTAASLSAPNSPSAASTSSSTATSSSLILTLFNDSTSPMSSFSSTSSSSTAGSTTTSTTSTTPLSTPAATAASSSSVSASPAAAVAVSAVSGIIGPEAGLLIRHGQSWCEIILEILLANNNPSTTSTPSVFTSTKDVGLEESKKLTLILARFVKHMGRLCSLIARQKPTSITIPCFVGAVEKFWAALFAVATPGSSSSSTKLFASIAGPLITDVNLYFHPQLQQQQQHQAQSSAPTAAIPTMQPNSVGTALVEFLASCINASATLTYHPFDIITTTTASSPPSNLNLSWPTIPAAEDARVYLGSPISLQQLLTSRQPNKIYCALVKWIEGGENNNSNETTTSTNNNNNNNNNSKFDIVASTILLRAVCESCLGVVLGPQRRRVNPISLAATVEKSLVRAISFSYSNQKLTSLAAEAISSLLNHSVSVFSSPSSSSAISNHDCRVEKKLAEALINFMGLSTTTSSSSNPTPNKYLAVLRMLNRLFSGADGFPCIAEQPRTNSNINLIQVLIKSAPILLADINAVSSSSSPSSSSSSYSNIASPTSAVASPNSASASSSSNPVVTTSSGQSSSTSNVTSPAVAPAHQSSSQQQQSGTTTNQSSGTFAPTSTATSGGPTSSLSVVAIAATAASSFSSSAVAPAEFQMLSSAILATCWQWHFQPSSIPQVIENISRICDRPMDSRSATDWQHICGYLTTIILDNVIVSSDDGLQLCGCALDRLCRIAAKSESPSLNMHVSNAFRLIMDGFACVGFTDMFQNLMRFIVAAMCAIIVRQLPLATTDPSSLPRCFFALATLLHAVTFRCGNSGSSFSMVVEVTRFCRRERVHGFYTTYSVGSIELLVAVDPKKFNAMHHHHQQQQQQQQNNNNNNNKQQQQQQSNNFNSEILLSPQSPPWHGNVEDDTDGNEEENDESSMGSPLTSFNLPASSSSSSGSGGGINYPAASVVDYEESRFERRIRSMARLLRSLCLTTLTVPNAPPPPRASSSQGQEGAGGGEEEEEEEALHSVAYWDVHAGRTIGCTSHQEEHQEKEKMKQIVEGVDSFSSFCKMRYATVDDIGSFEWDVVPLVSKDKFESKKFSRRKKTNNLLQLDDDDHQEQVQDEKEKEKEKKKEKKQHEQQQQHQNEKSLNSLLASVQSDMLSVRGDEDEDSDDDEQTEKDSFFAPRVQQELSPPVPRRNDSLNMFKSEQQQQPQHDEDDDFVSQQTRGRRKSQLHVDPVLDSTLITNVTGETQEEQNLLSSVSSFSLSPPGASAGNNNNNNNNKTRSGSGGSTQMKKWKQEQKQMMEKEEGNERIRVQDEDNTWSVCDLKWSPLLLDSIGCLSPSEQHRRIMPWRTVALRVLPPKGMLQHEGSFYQKLRETQTHRNKYIINLVVPSLSGSSSSSSCCSSESANKYSETASKQLLEEIVQVPRVGGIATEIASDGLHGLRRTATEEFHIHVVGSTQSHSHMSSNEPPNVIVCMCASHREMYEIAATANFVAVANSNASSSSSGGGGGGMSHFTTASSSSVASVPILFVVPTRDCAKEEDISTATFVPHVKRTSPAAVSIFPFFDGAPLRGLSRLAMTLRSSVLLPASLTSDIYRHRRHKMRVATGSALASVPRGTRQCPALAAATEVGFGVSSHSVLPSSSSQQNVGSLDL